MYLSYIYIAIGGALGALSRYFLSIWIYNRTNQVFPLGTFVVNIVGCFLLGLFYTLSLEKVDIAPQVRMGISVGFLGAFTTFSTFSLETLNVIRENNLIIALLNIVLSVTIGLLAVWLGATAANFFSNLGRRSDEPDEVNREGAQT